MVFVASRIKSQKIGARVSLDCANRAQSEGVLQTTTEVHQTSVVTTDVLMGLMCCLMCVELTRGYKSPIFASHCVEALNPFAELLWQCYKLMSCCGVATMCSIGFAIRCRKFVLKTCMDKLNVRLEKLKTGYRLPPLNSTCRYP